MLTAKRCAWILWLGTGPLLAQTPMAPMDMPHASPAPSLPLPAQLPSMAGRAPLTLDDFLSMADRNNPTLLQAAATIRRSEALARQAGLYPNPTIGYEGDQIRGGSYGGGEQGGFVEQTIVLGGKLGLRSQIYRQQQQADEAAAETQRMRVHGDVTQMFLSAVSAQQTVEVRGRLLALARDAVETAHQLANVGQADAPDVLQAEVEAEQADIDYAVAQRSFIQYFKELTALAGSPHTEIAPLQGKLDALPDIDLDHIVQTITQQSPAVKQAQQLVLVAEAKWKDAKREAVPDLQVKAGEQANLESLSGSPGRAVGAQSFASAGIELPLWNRNQGNARAAEVELEQARQEVTRTQLAAREQAEVLLQQYASAKLEAERYRNALLPRARQAYELYLAKYQSMAQAYPQVIVSQRTLFELEMRSIDSWHRAWQSAVALQNFALQGALDKLPPNQ